jgi:hypothetical protein
MISKPKLETANRHWSQKETMKIVLLGLACFLGTSVAAENDKQLSQEYLTCLEKPTALRLQ